MKLLGYLTGKTKVRCSECKHLSANHKIKILPAEHGQTKDLWFLAC